MICASLEVGSNPHLISVAFSPAVGAAWATAEPSQAPGECTATPEASAVVVLGSNCCVHIVLKEMLHLSVSVLKCSS